MTRRDERKRETRQALIEAVFNLMNAGRPLAQLGLREITREAGVVPTAFYRHFRDLDELGIALADHIGLTVRKAVHHARLAVRMTTNLPVEDSVRAFLSYVRANPRLFEMLARERVGAPQAVRVAIEREVSFFITELAADLRLFPPLAHLSDGDRNMIADLIVNTALLHAGQILQLPGGRQSVEEYELTERIVKQMGLIIVGATHWHG